MKYRQRFVETEKRAKDWCWDEDESNEDREENFKDFDAEIQDIAHQIERENTEHDSRHELKKELRKYAREFVFKHFPLGKAV